MRRQREGDEGEKTEGDWLDGNRTCDAQVSVLSIATPQLRGEGNKFHLDVLTK